MFEVRPHQATGLKYWLDQAERIDMEPSYQRRGKRWSLADKQYLIDSVLNGFDMPKFYFADFSYFPSNLNEARKPFAIIDGKQRFEALTGFFNDDFALSKHFVLFDDVNRQLGGLTFSRLASQHPDIAKRFENFPVIVMTVITDRLEMVQQLFLRLNKMANLTGAEYRNAMSGPIPDLIREVAGHDFFRECVSFPISKGEDFNCAAKLLYLHHNNKILSTKRKDLDAFVATHQNTVVVEFNYTMSKVKLNLDRMVAGFGERSKLLKSEGEVPVFSMVFEKVKTEPELIVGAIREFKKNELAVSNVDPDHLNEVGKACLEYRLARRNVNDQQGLLTMINILSEYVASVI